MAYGTGIALMSCKNGEYFANLILEKLNINLEEKISLIKTKEVRFANTEIKSNILESIRGKDVFIVQDLSNYSNNYSIDDNLRALKTLTNAAKISDASRITIIIPTFPYARQEKPWGRECVTAKMVAREIELAGANQIITLDLHNPATVGFFNNANLENLKALKSICDYIKENIDLTNLVIASPDTGGIKRATNFASYLSRPIVSIYKERDYSKESFVDTMKLIGDVENKDVLLVDDMLDTGGTAKKSIELLKNNKANNIYFACSLPFLNGKAVSRLDELYSKGLFNKLITTNAVYKDEDFIKSKEWYVQIDISKYFAKVIYNIHNSKAITNYL
jgi:ribose-phosphate pyrophosphokinase